jgi:dienelactone hydrolase
MRVLAIGLVVLLPANLWAQDFTDRESRCFGMHCCPSGSAMAARHSSDEYVCRPAQQTQEDCFVDFNTQRQSMHACPDGTYMRGMSSKNQLVCCFDLQRGYSPFSDAEVVQHNNKSNAGLCGAPNSRSVMTGIENSKGLSLCHTLTTPTPPVANPVAAQLSSVEKNRSFCRAHSGSCDPNVTPDHDQWKRLVRNWLSRILNIPVASDAYKKMPAVTAEPSVTFASGVVRTKIHYKSLVDGMTLYAYVFMPPRSDAKLHPAVLVTHGHFGEAKEGTGVLWDKPAHAAALYLAERGAITLAPDTRTFGQSWNNKSCGAPPSRDNYDYHNCIVADDRFGAYPPKYILDNLLHMTVLLGQNGADPSQTFVVGLSLGGYQALWTAALDERVTGGALSAGHFFSMSCYGQEADNCQPVPSLTYLFNSSHNADDMLIDEGDLAGLVAPTPLFATWGDQDHLTTHACINRATQQASAIYDRIGHSAQFTVRTFAGMAHAFDDATAAELVFGRPPPVTFDYGTQCRDGSSTLHCCPAGQAMVGGNVGENRFMCTPVPGATGTNCRVDAHNQRDNMHACLAGEYMSGLHREHNHLLCCPGGHGNEAVDPARGAQRLETAGMHACSADGSRVLHGIHAVDDHFLCGDR